jgi:iron(II)-dependent oxidoreductase
MTGRPLPAVRFRQLIVLPHRTETTSASHEADPLPAEGYAELLREARERTLALVDRVSDHDLERVHDPLMSPLVWDLGHIAAFEDHWLCCRVGRLEPLRRDLMDVYDADETPRAGRGGLAYLHRGDALRYMADVRERALAVLGRTDLSDGADPLDAAGFVWEMVLRHEHQHNETMLQTLALAAPGVYVPQRRELPAGDAPACAAVTVTGGPFALGAHGCGFSYDNERPGHEVDLPAFAIDRTPVTNGAYTEFIDDGGYRRPELWTQEGWAWRHAEGALRPLYWTGDGGVRSFERIEPLDPLGPVMHVSGFEADAYARWRGARLPTEAEWEKAASWDAASERKRRFPWGDGPPDAPRANLDQLAFGSARCGAYPAGASPDGALGLIGDCWEWTATELRGYPGFQAFPYRQYSEAFFGSAYRVLRGGSWATRRRVASTTFRNWDLPRRRQIFAGFRCATDVPQR